MIRRSTVVVGPEDHGRRMTLDDFEFAEVKEGHLYELGRAIIEVSDVPEGRHGAAFDCLRDQLVAYKLANPEQVRRLFGGSECKLVIPSTESERHPDLTLYKTPQPVGPNPWRAWLPDVVIEIVSTSSARRDYGDKREDYWELGIREYWIVDLDRREVVALRRGRAKWSDKLIAEDGTYTTRFLPGFVLHLAPVFAAADAAGE
jgi:Uma2 family endonuclease